MVRSHPEPRPRSQDPVRRGPVGTRHHCHVRPRAAAPVAMDVRSPWPNTQPGVGDRRTWARYPVPGAGQPHRCALGVVFSTCSGPLGGQPGGLSTGAARLTATAPVVTSPPTRWSYGDRGGSLGSPAGAGSAKPGSRGREAKLLYETVELVHVLITYTWILWRSLQTRP
jgi:hypothetical protein